MARTRRLLVVAAAWAIPIAWIAVALLSGPSDGTMISPSGAMLGADRWGESITVVRTYGDTPLREGDVISRIDDVPIGEWVDGRPPSSRDVGDVVRYEVIRPGAELDQRRVIAVPLIRYPAADAAYHNIVTLVLFAMLLSAASLAYWRRPRLPAAGAFLLAASLVTALLDVVALRPRCDRPRRFAWHLAAPGRRGGVRGRDRHPPAHGAGVPAGAVGIPRDGPPPLRTPCPWRATPRGRCSSPSGWSLPRPASRA